MTNVPVALIFFARPDKLRKTFESIRNAKPKQLFLIQDGPRDNCFSDLEKIKECREIVSSVDWDCEVYKNYSEVNLGCGARVSSGVSWAFEYVDRLAIIEDDCVPAAGFFPFCEELLERYKSDARIDMISGMNNLCVYNEAPSDYFFSEEGSIAGWATWKRVWDNIDFNFGSLDDAYARDILARKRGDDFIRKAVNLKTKLEKGEKLSSWSIQRGINMLLSHGLIIIPKYNLISNIGLGDDSANSSKSLRTVPRGLRSLYYMKTHPINFPLKHPDYVVRDQIYEDRLRSLMGRKSKAQKAFRKAESFLYRVFYGDVSLLVACKIFYKKLFLQKNRS